MASTAAGRSPGVGKGSTLKVLIPFGSVVTLADVEYCSELGKTRAPIPLAVGAEQEAISTTMVTTKVIDIVITDRFSDAPGRPNGELLLFSNGPFGRELALANSATQPSYSLAYLTGFGRSGQPGGSANQRR